ncbi:hypothetical protein ACI4BE_30030, partial [Klebsiella pneumoniae]|uniref:hypothetical protein n=1 Tax=Klebsiella pneumoniae TaxID=573 RepID=UPI003852956F
DGGPGHIEPIRYENSQRFHLLSTLLLEPWSNAVGNPVAPNAEGVVSVAGRKMMKLQSDRIYTRLADGYAGQIIHIVSDG